MSKVNQLWTLAITWVTKKIRSPFSNYATKFVLFLGSGVVATPLLEHLILNAILKNGFGIDLGIEVPDKSAYVTGGCLIALALAHNLLFIHLNNRHQIEAKKAEVEVYKEAWRKLDTALDDTARLVNLYFTHYSEEEEALTLKAENSVIACAEWLRQNRPFYFSEAFYKQCADINNDAYVEIRGFRGCMRAKQKEEATIGKNASLSEQLDFYKNNYDYNLAQKEANINISRIRRGYDKVCGEIRSHIGSL